VAKLVGPGTVTLRAPSHPRDVDPPVKAQGTDRPRPRIPLGRARVFALRSVGNNVPRAGLAVRGWRVIRPDADRRRRPEPGEARQ